MSFLPEKWEKMILNPIKDDAHREGVDARMFAVCGIPYNPKAPFHYPALSGDPDTATDFLTFPPTECDSNGMEIEEEEEEAQPLQLEDLFFHKLTGLVTKAEMGDLYLLLAVIISTAMARVRPDCPQSPEVTLTTVLLRGGNTGTFRRGILGLLVFLRKLLDKGSEVPPCYLIEILVIFGAESITKRPCNIHPRSPLGLTHRICALNLEGDNELLIDGETMWEWINEKRGGFAFANRYAEVSGVPSTKVSAMNQHLDKGSLWCAVSSVLYL